MKFNQIGWCNLRQTFQMMTPTLTATFKPGARWNRNISPVRSSVPTRQARQFRVLLMTSKTFKTRCPEITQAKSILNSENINSIPGTTCTEMMYADKQEGKLDC